MTLFDDLKKKYRVNVTCSNCGSFSELTIPKGITIAEFFKSGQGKCQNCGCSTLKLKSTGQEQVQPADKWFKDLK